MKTVQVPFRLLRMDCCEVDMRWIEEGVPRYCPMCGTGYAPHALPAVLTEDLQAALTARPAPVPQRPPDEPCTDVRLLFDTLMPLLEGLAGIARALAVASPDTMPRGQAAALRALAAQAEVAPTILQRWWEANHEDD